MCHGLAGATMRPDYANSPHKAGDGIAGPGVGAVAPQREIFPQTFLLNWAAHFDTVAEG